MKNEPAIEDLIELYLKQYSCGEASSPEEFANAYPAHRDELLQILPLLQEMEDIREENDVFEPYESINSPILSDFECIREIGRGGMGVVYEALQLSLQRKVALKFLSTNLTKSQHQRAQFEQEAQIIAKLHHPNIVKILSAECKADQCYYAMELIDGQGLDQCQFKRPRQIAAIGLQAAKALAYAHSCGIMHRDIKPSNILLDAKNQVHVSDFGLACLLPEGYEFQETEESRSGTLRYMSPERLLDGVNSFAADQYALGASLFEVIAQKPLLTCPSLQQLKEQLSSKKGIPRLICKEPELASIINKSLSHNPNNRYRSMDAFAADLERFLQHKPVQAHSYSWPHRFILWVKRKPAIATLSFAMLLCCLCLFAALLLGYWRTNEALKMAETNAAYADKILSQVFTRVSEQPASQGNAQLLSDLLPYYEHLVRAQASPHKDIQKSLDIMAACAINTGNYSLAENTIRQILATKLSSKRLNELAEVLEKQGKQKEAQSTYRKVVELYARSKNPTQQYHAACALLGLAQTSESPELDQAYEILKSLLHAKPKNPNYRFIYAQLLAKSPQRARELPIENINSNAYHLLCDLSDEYPQNAKYALALIELCSKRLQTKRGLSESELHEFSETITLAERLLSRHPNNPQMVDSVVCFYLEFIRKSRRSSNKAQARKLNERLSAILEFLYYNPEISDSVRENYINLQLIRIELFQRNKDSKNAKELIEQIKAELEHYHGNKKAEFEKKLAESQKDES